MSEQDMRIFNRSFDLLSWLLPATNHFPKAHRHTLTRRLLDATFDLRERLEEANIHRGAERLEQLHHADAALARVRVYLRLVFQLSWFSCGQFQHVSAMVVEIGRLLGGWKKTVLSA